MPALPTDDPEVVRKHAKLLPSVKDPALFQEELQKACLWFSSDLHERARFDQKAVHARLDDLASRIDELRVTLQELGYDAQEALEEAAERQKARPRGDRGESIWQWVEPQGTRAKGRERVIWVARVLENLSDWAHNARADVGTPPPGRPKNWPVIKMLERLVGIWEAHSGEAPTLISDPEGKYGKFLDFCRNVIQPICEIHGVDQPPLTGMIQSVLYPPPEPDTYDFTPSPPHHEWVSRVSGEIADEYPVGDAEQEALIARWRKDRPRMVAILERQGVLAIAAQVLLYRRREAVARNLRFGHSSERAESDATEQWLMPWREEEDYPEPSDDYPLPFDPEPIDEFNASTKGEPKKRRAKEQLRPED